MKMNFSTAELFLFGAAVIVTLIITGCGAAMDREEMDKVRKRDCPEFMAEYDKADSHTNHENDLADFCEGEGTGK